jgi:uncharacterized protein
MGKFTNKWVVVTGASSGIGAGFAREVAKLGGHLILVARRTNRLESLQKELQENYSSEVISIFADLSTIEGARNTHKTIAKLGKDISFLINNAAAGLHGKFGDLSYEDQAKCLYLNVNSLTELTYLFLEDFLVLKRGGILNISSIIASHFCPNYATYAASKAYVLSFTQALHHEYKSAGIAISTLCPGPTATEFFEKSGEKPSAIIRFFMISPEKCAQIGLKALSNNKLVSIPGFVNWLWFHIHPFIPKFLGAFISNLLH